MRLKWRQKMFSWLKTSGRKKTCPEKNLIASRGVLPLSIILFFFLGLGVCVLLLTQVHLKVGGLRRNLRLTNYAAENGLKMGYLFLLEKLQSSPWPLSLSESETEFILSNSLSSDKSLWLFRQHLGLDFPVFLESSWKSMAWKSKLSFEPKTIESPGCYILAVAEFRLEAEGKIMPFFQRAKGEFLLDAVLVAGYLPLPLFPCLLEKSLSLSEQEEYLKLIEIIPPSAIISNLALRPFFSQEKTISRDTIPFLEKGLKIRLFEPDSINTLVLRQALGLEISREPIPEGVYLIHDDIGLGGVFVQGSLDELLLVVDGPYQVLFFRQGENTWELRFNPSLGQTIFSSPGKSLVYEGLPNGIILVNGAIASLGEGEAGLSGEVHLATREPQPCLIPGAKLTLVASGEVNIVSPLTLSSFNLEPGIPYLRQRQTQLVVFSSGKDLITQEEMQAGLNLEIRRVEEVVVEADLIALGNGFQMKGRDKTLVIKGSLQTTEINPNSNRIKIIPHENPYLLAKEPEGLPLTSRPLSVIIQLKPTRWIDNAKGQ
ncbi:MAG: hypothetical protein ACUVR0_11370 [Candidatus Aminicenantales bacterium]